MKISVNKILFHWFQKKPINYKYWSTQLSILWNPRIHFELSIVTDYYPILTISLFGLFNFQVYNSVKEDHAGFHLNLNILGLDWDLQHHDTRHWNYELEDWEK